MTTTAAPKSPTEILAAIKEQALSEVTYSVRQLDRFLANLQRDVLEARESIKAGRMVQGSTSFGPIGHQAPFDISKATEQLRSAMAAAMNAGATREEVDAAYTKKGF